LFLSEIQELSSPLLMESCGQKEEKKEEGMRG